MATARVQLDYGKVTSISKLRAVTLTQKQVEREFNVSAMSIYLWRKQGVDAFPCHVIPTDGGGRRICFVRHEVESWFKRNRPEKVQHLQKGELNDRIHGGSPGGDLGNSSQRTAA